MEIQHILFVFIYILWLLSSDTKSKKNKLTIHICLYIPYYFFNAYYYLLYIERAIQNDTSTFSLYIIIQTRYIFTSLKLNDIAYVINQHLTNYISKKKVINLYEILHFFICIYILTIYLMHNKWTTLYNTIIETVCIIYKFKKYYIILHFIFT